MVYGVNGFCLHDSRIIEEENSECEPYTGVRPNVEEHKSLQEENSDDSDENCFNVEFSESMSAEPTPRFDKDHREITILSIEEHEVITFPSTRTEAIISTFRFFIFIQNLMVLISTSKFRKVCQNLQRVVTRLERKD